MQKYILIKSLLVLLIPLIIYVYTTVIEGMRKRPKIIKKGMNYTISNGAFVQAAIKSKGQSK